MKTRYTLPVIASVLVTIVLWASAFPGIRAGLQAYSPGSLALLRFLIASVVLLIVGLIRGLHLPKLKDLPGIMLTSLSGITLYNLALNYGEVNVTASTASFIVNTGPIFTALLAFFLLNERIKAWGWLGIFIGFGGVSIIALANKGGSLNFEPSAFLVLTAAIFQSLFFVFQKPYLKAYKPFEFTTYAIWSGTLFLLVFLPGLISEISTAPLVSTLAVSYLGVFPAALAYITWAYALFRLPAAKAASFLYCVPLLATLIAWVWLGETPSFVVLAGGVITLIGVFLAQKLSNPRVKNSKIGQSFTMEDTIRDKNDIINQA